MNVVLRRQHTCFNCERDGDGEGGATVNDGMFAQQDHFAASGAAGFVVERDRCALELLDDLSRSRDLDLAGFDQHFNHRIEEFLRHIGARGNGARV